MTFKKYKSSTMYDVFYQFFIFIQEATVEVQGSVWDESNQYAMTLAKDPGRINPFNLCKKYENS